MDFVRRVSGGRRLGQRSHVNGVAVRHPPDAIAGGSRRAQRPDRGNLAIERRIDLAGDDFRRAAPPITGDRLRRGPAGDRICHGALFRRG